MRENRRLPSDRLRCAVSSLPERRRVLEYAATPLSATFDWTTGQWVPSRTRPTSPVVSRAMIFTAALTTPSLWLRNWGCARSWPTATTG